jgi:aminoglycoside phosphotransferase (APT) family kinase protein
MTATLEDRLRTYLADKLKTPDLTIANLARIPGGASRETYRFRARYTQGKKSLDRALILRRDPTASLIETERSTEFRAYQAFHKLGLPVPEPIALELGSAALERPFFIMAPCARRWEFSSSPISGALRAPIPKRLGSPISMALRA